MTMPSGNAASMSIEMASAHMRTGSRMMMATTNTNVEELFFDPVKKTLSMEPSS